MQPHWLQDTFDQTCLSPMGGFSECGDATLWLVIPKQRRHERRRQWIRWATEEQDDNGEAEEDLKKPQGYALQLVDDANNYLHNGEEGSAPSIVSSQDFSQKECLTRRRKDSKLVLAPCSQERSWSWQFNEHGILHFEKKSKNKKSSNNKNKRILLKKQKTLEQCVWRNATEALLLPCDDEASQVNLTSDVEERVVQIALVRQAAATFALSPDAAEASSTSRSSTTSPSEDAPRIPHQKDIAHIHASGPALHAEPKQASRLTSLSRQKASESTFTSTTTNNLPLRFLKDTNPILLAGGREPASSSKRGADKSKKTFSMEAAKSILHETTPSASSMKPMIRKIQVNPYIVASQDERWTDPLTGLEYRTDLCQYLGHDRLEVGRHTLMGVGQYMKTVFNIKVYGVAFYASKRDVLADPVMERFASLSSEELREQTDFYSVLRNMASYSSASEPGPGGSFDKTIFLKTNMQLSLETMRSSLEADWKMLTQEAKDLLIGSSMKPRPASPAMLSVISAQGNPSKCSCSQIAPEEYNSDPNCCARGTELVFTWRKNGDLEVRLNGDFMDTYSRPDVAAGIFFEYLRLDDPMSVDFLDRVPDGFPFLLAPLSQVKGVSSPIISQTSPSSKRSAHASSNPVLKALEGFGEAVSSTSNNIAGLVHTSAGFVHNSANELTNSAINTARSVGDTARNLSEEMERRRDKIGKHVSAFAHQTMSTFYGRDQKSLTVVLPKWVGDMSNLHLGDMAPDSKQRTSGAPRGQIFKNTILSRLFGIEEPPAAPDEIVPMIYPPTNATQRLFLGIVHLYLLLMLIVSFPAQLTTRTKMIVIRKTAQAISDSENSDSDEASTGSLDPSPRKSAPAIGSNNNNNGVSRFRPFRSRRHQNDHDDTACPSPNDGQIKKSLSYVL